RSVFCPLSLHDALPISFGVGGFASMRRIREKTALVTGAASGIGRAIALRLADEGARLYMLDINPVALASVVAEAKQRGVEVIGRDRKSTRLNSSYVKIS